VSLRKKLGKVLLLGMLQVGAFAGAPVRPEEIEKLMDVSQSKIVRVEREREPLNKPTLPFSE
jgi:hypothetical protein